MTDDSTYLWPAVTKDPGTTKPVALSAWALCTPFWTPNEEYAEGEYVWPNIVVRNGQIVKGANGFCYQCFIAGRVGAKEPKWPVFALYADQPQTPPKVIDGSVVWLTVPAALQGVTAISSVTATSSDPALVVSAPLVDELTKILVDYSGGVANTDYEVEFQFTIASRTRVGRQIVQVRKK